MLVDIAELLSSVQLAQQASPAQLLALWNETIERATQALQSPPTTGFDAVIDGASEPLMALIERDADLAIFQVMRQHGNRLAQYGVNHSVHCAIAAFVTAKRLGWANSDVQLAVKAALTMNLSMRELQGQLREQLHAPTDSQRENIRTHPLRSVAILEQAGIRNRDWLRAVAEHHEHVGGCGYPHGLNDIAPVAMLLRQCDVYTT